MVPTTVAPYHRDSAIIGESCESQKFRKSKCENPRCTEPTIVVILLVLCTLAGLVYLLYRYLCHNKGIYRTTGEAAPGVDPDQVFHDTVTENKEYFI